jgi:hypothetical protein
MTGAKVGFKGRNSTILDPTPKPSDGLTTYDAAYLELAMRTSLPPASQRPGAGGCGPAARGHDVAG